ncbi:MAG: extracellular solute-binding protein [Clostridiaceae bacterium]|jgi:multiple sugar transport system substrate-binding protein|nr:extracellular solute-binding protein [Clostridiaceae bacterium]
MGKVFKFALILALVFSLTLSIACNKRFEDVEGTTDTTDNVGQEAQIEATKQDVEIEMWGWFSFGGSISTFEEKTGIKVKEKIIPFHECKNEYMKALANGTGPDLLVFDSSFFGQYTVNNILENLLDEPYKAEKYKGDIIGWESGFSLDNKQLLSLSYSTAPYITMYREDIMRENGFPSEPEEFGKFIEHPDNILKVSKKLKEQGKFIFQYPTDITDIVGATMGYFDEEFNYIREGEMYAKAIDMAQEMYDNDLISNKNFWNDTGKKAVNEDKLVMFFLASYAMDELEKMAPDQKGKWRVTTSPLGIAAWGSDTRLSINAHSEHKEETWKLIEHLVTSVNWTVNVVPSYIPATTYNEYLSQQKDFFGGQNVYPMLVDLAINMNQYKLTPLDEEVRELYLKGIWQSLLDTKNSHDKIEQMRKEIEKELEEEKNVLLE